MLQHVLPKHAELIAEDSKANAMQEVRINLLELQYYY